MNSIDSSCPIWWEGIRQGFQESSLLMYGVPELERSCLADPDV